MPSEQKIIVIPDGKICDYIDGKFRNDTPEEYVRQTIEKRLVNEHKYLPEQIRIEYTLKNQVQMALDGFVNEGNKPSETIDSSARDDNEDDSEDDDLQFIDLN